jgi:hypothetical protein
LFKKLSKLINGENNDWLENEYHINY